MLGGVIVFGAILLFVVSLAGRYNRLVTTSERAMRAWNDLESLLHQRHDEIPKLLELCQPHLDSARADFARVLDGREAVLAARQTHDPDALGGADRALRSAIAALLARAAAAPELGASPGFALVRQRHATLAEEIDDRRARYNEAVAAHNAALRRPLGVIVALLGRFRQLPTLAANDAAENALTR
jgi:LemA protein